MKFFSSAKKPLTYLNKIWQEASEQTRKNALIKTPTDTAINTEVGENITKTKTKAPSPVLSDQIAPESVDLKPQAANDANTKHEKIAEKISPHSEVAKIWLEATSRDLQMNHDMIEKKLETPSLTPSTSPLPSSKLLAHSNLAQIYLEAMTNNTINNDNNNNINNINDNNNKTTLPADKQINDSNEKEIISQYAETQIQSDDEYDESFSSYYVSSQINHQQNNIKSESNDIITVNGITGVWVNKEECLNWRGPIPLEQYKINQDSNPTIIRKKRTVNTDSIQRICVRFLKPPPMPTPGDLIIKEELQQLPPAPPIVIRQQVKASVNYQPIVIREKPPKPPTTVPVQTITIPGERTLEPPPRQVIIERVPAPSTTAPDVIVERWLSYPRQKRNIVYDKHAHSQENLIYKKPQNIIIDWETTSRFVDTSLVETNVTEHITQQAQPNIIIDWEANDQNFHTIENVNTNVTFLGVETTDPVEYENKHSSELIDSRDLPHFVNEYKTPLEEQLASNLTSNEYILEGDVEALQLVSNQDELNKYLLTKF